jgi:hypothetical protein
MLRELRRRWGVTANLGPVDGTKKETKRGLVVGELLVAFVLLVVAISSLTALMYSVTRHPRTRGQAVECTEKGTANSPKCVAEARATNGGKLLVAGCATRSGAKVQECNEGKSAQSSNGTTLRSRTDSASLEMLPKKVKRSNRTDLGFIR